ncbi:DUF2189 domain-containing protein [Primorskyibacter sp. S87]|uniref:DUF2189 domain-containing protein n=1 Tax=Primorskyibacter sp. S87 TaxID=3415126 RepID=UPI003C7D858F
MAKTIGNPLSWTAGRVGDASEHLSDSVSQLGGTAEASPPMVLDLNFGDVRAALFAGYEDFKACRADVIFIAVVYPIAGLVLMGLGLQMELLPLLAPLVAGFAILGPVAAVGLYEMSRRREQGKEVHWIDAFGVFRSPSSGAILILGLYLTGLFVTWMMCAQAIYAQTLGPEPPASAGAFMQDIFTTSSGWSMIVTGLVIGALFAVVALAISVVSFPLLLDKSVGVPVAVVTSVRVLRRNPVVILSWGCIVAGVLVLGALPMLLGLIIVVPILGHATWHLYRRAVA